MNPDLIAGIYYMEFTKMLKEMRRENYGLFKNHVLAFVKWRNQENLDFCSIKLKKVVNGFVMDIISNLDKYFPDNETIKNTKIMQLQS